MKWDNGGWLWNLGKFLVCYITFCPRFSKNLTFWTMLNQNSWVNKICFWKHRIQILILNLLGLIVRRLVWIILANFLIFTHFRRDNLFVHIWFSIHKIYERKTMFSFVFWNGYLIRFGFWKSALSKSKRANVWGTEKNIQHAVLYTSFYVFTII